LHSRIITRKKISRDSPILRKNFNETCHSVVLLCQNILFRFSDIINITIFATVDRATAELRDMRSVFASVNK